jgi:hypothetical protein
MTPLTAKIVFKPLGLGLSLAAGALASLVARRLWLWVSDDEELPDADDTDTGWLKLLSGAALEAAVFAVAKASATRLQAQGIRHAIENDKKEGR